MQKITCKIHVLRARMARLCESVHEGPCTGVAVTGVGAMLNRKQRACGHAGPFVWPTGDPKPDPASWYAGLQYDVDIANAKSVLAELDKYYPDASSYEVAGFFWWQVSWMCWRCTKQWAGRQIS